MENFKKEIALEINEHGFRVFIPPFGTTSTQCSLARADVDVSRPAFFGTKPLDGGDQTYRYPGVIARRQFLDPDGPQPALHNHFPAAKTRHVRGTPEQERVKSERYHPRASK